MKTMQALLDSYAKYGWWYLWHNYRNCRMLTDLIGHMLQ